ncbi:hypothetical protein Tco_1090695 [Tanacetum coccineum]|uniref:Uncharacterized protein n=1 Tax=Tanacetum coccineum TaxID=301880 RepID=A0ABQ5I4Z8_9ASTR
MTGKKPTDDMFSDGLSLHKFAYMALPDHAVDVIDGDAIVLQSTEANAKKVEECLVATIKIGVSCSVDSPPQRMKIEIVVNELQRILDVLLNLDEMSFEEAVGRLTAYEERIKSQDTLEANDQDKLLMASSNNKSYGKWRGRDFNKEKGKHEMEE